MRKILLVAAILKFVVLSENLSKQQLNSNMILSFNFLLKIFYLYNYSSSQFVMHIVNMQEIHRKKISGWVSDVLKQVQFYILCYTLIFKFQSYRSFVIAVSYNSTRVGQAFITLYDTYCLKLIHTNILIYNELIGI